MKLRYLSAAALALGLFAGQPVLAQSMAQDSASKTSQSHTHKKKSKKKRKASAPAPAADTMKAQ